jgi:phosphate transport system protein
MVRDAVDTFRREDARKARTIMERDDRVDALYSQLLGRLAGQPPPGGRPRSTGLILLARSLERIADHATNICEEVFYLVEGADIRHRAVDKAPASS